MRSETVTRRRFLGSAAPGSRRGMEGEFSRLADAEVDLIEEAL
jgi:hypothetical protein